MKTMPPINPLDNVTPLLQRVAERADMPIAQLGEVLGLERRSIQKALAGEPVNPNATVRSLLLVLDWLSETQEKKAAERRRRSLIAAAPSP